MKYYYLDSENKVQGPVSEAELRVLRESGRLSDETKAAAAGDTGWKSLADLLNQTSSQCSTWNNSDCKCPHCRHVLEGLEENGKCLHCEEVAVEKGRGVWSAFIDCIRRSFDYKGRSTRTEFWGFCLFYYIFSWLIEHGVSYLFIPDSTTSLFQKQMEQASVENDLQLASHALGMFFSEASVIISISLYWLYVILMTFPFLAVSVRRLHDVGKSAAAVVFGCLSHLFFMLSLVGLIVSLFIDIEYFVADIPEIPESFTFALLSFIVSFLALSLISLYLLIMMLLPSQQGINKYGPAKI